MTRTRPQLWPWSGSYQSLTWPQIPKQTKQIQFAILQFQETFPFFPPDNSPKLSSSRILAHGRPTLNNKVEFGHRGRSSRWGGPTQLYLAHLTCDLAIGDLKSIQPWTSILNPTYRWQTPSEARIVDTRRDTRSFHWVGRWSPQVRVAPEPVLRIKSSCAGLYIRCHRGIPATTMI